MAATIIKVHSEKFSLFIFRFLKSQLDEDKAIEIASRIMTSPTRFEKAVIRPAAQDFWFW